MNTILTTFETVIGLEVHLQLNTRTKIFCGCGNYFGAEPNSLTCPVCLGLPGALPVVNQKAITHGIKVGLALNCQINTFVKFDRKNYFYPDCPKAYQISQFDKPIATQGFIYIPDGNDGEKIIHINRAHLEEDAGKLIHDQKNHCSLVDYNRTGTPLMEIVSEPDLRSPQEAYDYLHVLKLTLQYLNVSDCDMEKGSLRCDANISLKKKGTTTLGTKAELKNMNSFKAVKAGLEFEVNRQRQILLAGQEVIQETRLWDEERGVTVTMRGKEEAHDYRYFPDPDLVPFILEDTIIDSIEKELPELPRAKYHRLLKNYTLSPYDARILIQDPDLADFFETCTLQYKNIKNLCNWLNSNILKEINQRKTTVKSLGLTPKNLITLLKRVDENVISNLAAKEVLSFMIESQKDVDTIIREKGLAQVSDEGALDKIVDTLIAEHAQVAQQIREGKENAIGFLVGQAMRKTQGKANPKKIGEIIKRRILNG